MSDPSAASPGQPHPGGTVPHPDVISDKAWSERAEKRARRCVRNSTAYPGLAASYVAPLLAELDSLRRQRDAVLELHRPREWEGVVFCDECGPDEDIAFQVEHNDRGWPCRTIRALGVTS